MISEAKNIDTVKVHVKHEHLHFQQKDPITGALHWITLPIESIKELVDFLNKI